MLFRRRLVDTIAVALCLALIQGWRNFDRLLKSSSSAVKSDLTLGAGGIVGADPSLLLPPVPSTVGVADTNLYSALYSSSTAVSPPVEGNQQFDSVVLSSTSQDERYHTCTLPSNRQVTFPTAPHVLLIGALKSGTSALRYQLSNHNSKILGSFKTSPHFFDEDAFLDERMSQLDNSKVLCEMQQYYVDTYFFAARLRGSSTALLALDSTPNYMLQPKVPELVQRLCGPWRPKILVILRDPVDRLWSHYLMLRERHHITRSLESLLDEELAMLRDRGYTHAPPLGQQHRSHALANNASHFDLSANMPRTLQLDVSGGRKFDYLLARGLYALQLRDWVDRFPVNDQLLAIPHDRFMSQPSDTIHDVLRFLSLPPHQLARDDTVWHKKFSHVKAEHHVQRQVSNATRAYLTAFYAPHNQLLTDLLGSSWEGFGA